MLYAFFFFLSYQILLFTARYPFHYITLDIYDVTRSFTPQYLRFSYRYGNPIYKYQTADAWSFGGKDSQGGLTDSILGAAEEQPRGLQRFIRRFEPENDATRLATTSPIRPRPTR